MELLEETGAKRENRLREENQLLSEQNMTTLKMIEQEKADLVAAHIKRQEEWQNEKQNELDKLREIHRYYSWQGTNNIQLKILPRSVGLEAPARVLLNR